MPGTDIRHAGLCLRACYAMSGTDLGCAATRIGADANYQHKSVFGWYKNILLRANYAMSGTGIADYTSTTICCYALAMRCISFAKLYWRYHALRAAGAYVIRGTVAYAELAEYY
eukprot:2205552-Rhodomonas_salina.2